MKKVCLICKNTFYLNPRLGLNWAKKTNRGRFCSRGCYYIYRKGMRVAPETEFKKGQKPVNFKTGIWGYRKFLKEECFNCQSTKNLIVHHLDQNRNNNNPENLRTVCAKCHTNIYHPRLFYGNQYTI